jgi:hypothetical protein
MTPERKALIDLLVAMLKERRKETDIDYVRRIAMLYQLSREDREELASACALPAAVLV